MSRTVYLAGAITQDPRCLTWREEAREFFTNGDLNVLDPCRGKSPDDWVNAGLEGNGTVYDKGAYVARDLLDIQNSDVIFLVWWGDPGRQSIGTWFEVGYAFAQGKPIVVVDLSNDPTSPSKHPFIYRNASAVFSTLEDGLDYVDWLLSPPNVPSRLH